MIELSFPDHLDTINDGDAADAAQVGLAGDLEAKVTDTAAVQWVGKETITVVNHLPMWPVIVATSGTAYLTANAPTELEGDSSVQRSAPLLMSSPEGEGHLVLSAFRLGPAANTDMLAVTQAVLITLQGDAE